MRTQVRAGNVPSESKRTICWDGLLLNSVNLSHAYYYGNWRTKDPNILQGMSKVPIERRGFQYLGELPLPGRAQKFFL
ncbi:MAG: hypothetical protein E6L08_08960 [Verrucomicrobia bacterium]|nr:MAG: hypothetical protein E6L08_08960 [Verrucomicrobiota bacterium]